MQRVYGSMDPSDLKPCGFTHRLSPACPALEETPGIGDGGGGGISANPVEAKLSLGMQRNERALPGGYESDSDTGSLWDLPLWCDGGVIGSAAMPTICHASHQLVVDCTMQCHDP